MGEISEHLQADVTETLERKDNIKRWLDCHGAKTPCREFKMEPGTPATQSISEGSGLRSPRTA